MTDELKHSGITIEKEYSHMKNRTDGIWAALSVLIMVLLLRYHATVPKPLILSGLIAIVGIIRILRVRNSYQGSEEEKQEFNKIVRRSVILGPIIAIAFIAVVVIWKLKVG